MRPVQRTPFEEEILPVATEQAENAAAPILDAAPKGWDGSGGKVVYKDDAVEVRTGVTIKHDGKDTSFKDAIAIKVKCKKDPHVLQFINREVLGADGKAKKLKMVTTGGEYETTTDSKNPVWNTDSSAKPNPYYEGGFAARSDSSGLTVYDQPTVEAPVGPLKLATGETSRANFKSYAICDGKVLREVNWTRSVKQGGPPQYSVKVSPAKAVPQWTADQLKKQGYNAAP